MSRIINHFSCKNNSVAPSVIQRLNKKGLRHLSVSDWPNKVNEGWKYTSLQHLKSSEFLCAGKPSLENCMEALNQLDSEEKNNCLFLFNGHLIPSLSENYLLPNTHLQIIHSEDSNFDSEVEMMFESSIGPEDIMRSINSAFANNYLVVKVVGVAHQTLKIKNLELKASPENTFVVPRILLHLDKEASLQCEVNLMSTEIHLMDGIVDVYLSSGGKLDLAMTLKSSNDSSLILSNRVKMCDNSQLNVGLLAQGSKLTRVDQQVFIEGECCQADIAIVYQAKEHQQVDIHSTVNHLCPRGKSFQNIKGILEDKSRAIVNGRIYIQQGAQEVDSHLLNNNLLLSDNAEVNTKPELEVEADNVKAAHGATVGQLDKEELFYCATRAIDEKLARNLILKGFLLDAFNQNPFFVKSELLSSIEVTLD